MALKVGPYLLKEVLGSGSFADVRLAVHEKSGEKFAVKVFDKRKISCDDFETEVRREVKIMQYLRHPCIVSVHQVLMTGNNMYVVMELVTGGELYYEIVKHRRIPEDTSRKYFQDLVDAMAYCHRKGVYHRDLKPENLLLDGKGGIKITDFGMSWMREHSDQTLELLHTQCGTPKYMAPEVITKARYGYKGDKIDVWDCGMILFALMAGYLPFNGEDDRAVFRQIVFGRVKFPQWFSDGACDLLMHLLEKDPEKRWTLEQVRKHPWYLINYAGDPLERLRKEREARKAAQAASNRRSRSQERISVGRDYGGGVSSSGVSRGASRSRSRARGEDGGRARSRSAVRGGARTRSRSRAGGRGRRSDSAEGEGERRARGRGPAPPTDGMTSSQLAESFLQAAKKMEISATDGESGGPTVSSSSVPSGTARDSDAHVPKPPKIPAAASGSPKAVAAANAAASDHETAGQETPPAARKKPPPVTPIDTSASKDDATSGVKMSGRLVQLLSPRSQEKANQAAAGDANKGIGRLMNILSPKSAAAAAKQNIADENSLKDDGAADGDDESKHGVDSSEADAGEGDSASRDRLAQFFDGETPSSGRVTDEADDSDDLPKNFKGLKLTTTSKGVKRLVHKWKTTGAA
mmetsp:Transcript_1729/g.3734  ORF Transcript_1729/g.3734 Transcript_1729/m.3734 type:complete len:636 (-) Transcript_1729:670-2577(-)|eukprot:CAMPEP_0185843602 /NCGR_PEP_ID=MMETSP1354-20130828/32_1 /TAXON_ID=708628 /ORGANISM="Erythrolobus madagascarensis, Strain CCMP3276" /LENGTH=635 /DNA_ID=CAMNT_0028543119 /DNA_START=284 /DNA_END=2191 /DNA_ORIENTATION=+